MSAPTQCLALSALALSMLACAPAQSAPADGGVSNRDGAIVLSGIALTDGRGSVLGAMQGKVPNMRIQRRSGACPEINLRSHVSFQGVVNPHVYVDGTRSTDTCILESIRSEDVASVEVYPMGFTKRPGYGTHAHGLILIFMRGE